MPYDIGPPLASDSSACLSSSRSTLSTPRASSANTRRLRHELGRSTTAHWAFLTSTPQHLDGRRPYQPVKPSRPATARETLPPECTNLPKRPATSRRNHQRQHELLTPRGASVAIKEAMRRERDQEQYVNPLIGRSVEPRSQPTVRVCKLKPNAGGTETNTAALLSRVTSASMNATEKLRLRAFQARANGEYDRAIKFYTELTTARPNEIEAHFHLAVCLERTGQIGPALAAYKQVQRLSGGHHAFAYYNMGNLCMRSDQVIKAIEYFSHAITASKRSQSSSVPSTSVGSTPVAFYQQRAAAYRKNGDFEKAARDYVLVQKCTDTSNPSVSSEDKSTFSAEYLYQPVTQMQLASKSKTARPDEFNEDSNDDRVDFHPDESNQSEIEIEETDDALTTWALQRSMTIVRLPPSERNEGDLQYLSDFMQKRFTVCAALHPEVCRLLCRELALSPDGSLSAKTPIFMEHDADSGCFSQDRSLFFILQGRVNICKTTGRMFQPSPQKNHRETREAFIVDDMFDQQQEMWQSPWESILPVVNSEWQQSQLELCELDQGDVFGHQGKFADDPRAYSAIAMTSCAIGAISWSTWRRIECAQREAEQERAARFLTMTPSFNGICASDIRSIASRAKFVKVVGSKVLCCEGQYVDGLFVVREGELCQFSPCEMKAPPDMSVSFALSGALSIPQSGRAFFIQLETAGDPLEFLRVNDAFHGFLPQNYVIRKQRELLRLAAARSRSNSRRSFTGSERRGQSSEPLAIALRRGECFCVSSSWIPPRQSRQEEEGAIQGVACAKTTLVSVGTTELLFLSSADLTHGLSLDSRSQLHRNLQDIAVADKQSKSMIRPYRGGLPGKRSANLLEQCVQDERWSKFKEDLVENVLRGRC